jgi:hypothetical protein
MTRDAAVARDGGSNDAGTTRADSGGSDSGNRDAGNRDAGGSDAGARDGGIDIAAECATGCDHIVECDSRYDRAQCVEGCMTAARASDTPACRDRFRAVSMCVVSLECSELPPPMGSEIDLSSTRCGPEIDAFVDECVRG